MLPTIERRFAAAVRERQDAARDGRMISYGWHLVDGRGPAQHGWAWVWPAGRREWLGGSKCDVLLRWTEQKALAEFLRGAL